MFWDAIARRETSLGAEGETGVAAPPSADQAARRPRIGLALGAGAARGWAHIGVLGALEQAGIVPDVIAGCSIGAAVGGCYAAANLASLEAFARTLTKRRVMGLLDFHLGSGLIAGERLKALLERELADRRIEALPVQFAAVATELGSGHEIWLTRGRLVSALRASYALPGIFDPVKLGGRWLMDGALVNPIPITAARALGADVVICVNLNGDVRVRGTVIQSNPADESDDGLAAVFESRRRWSLIGAGRSGSSERARQAARPNAPGIAAVMVDAFNITQDRIARSRLAGDPPDVMISPKLAGIGLFEFHRAGECIELGRQAAERALPDILELVADACRPA